MSRFLLLVLGLAAIFAIISSVAADSKVQRWSERSQRKGRNPSIKKHSDEKKRRDALNPKPGQLKRDTANYPGGNGSGGSGWSNGS